VPELTQSRDVPGWHLVSLTKRRAVDFCRVTTAICPAGSLATAG
jgi:hypothetical protein